jgi:colanic acid biosynthesis glycosyl transferase WcaI
MYFLPDFGSAPILMNELASYLASKGNQVEVITTIPREHKRSDYKGRLYIKERLDGFYVKRFWTNAKNNPLGRLIAWSIYTICCILNIFTIKQGDVLFLRLPPLQLGLVGILAKKIKGAKFISNVQDIHPDLAIESGILKNRILIKIAKRLEGWIYEESDIITVISEGFKNNLLKKGVRPEKIRVIPNWVDVNFLKPLPKNNPISEKFSLASRFVIMYSGIISITNYLSLEYILEAAGSLRQDKDILFIIVGEGLKEKSLREKAAKLNLPNIRFLQFFPQQDLPYLLASSDILILPLDVSKAELSVPSKLYSFMAVQRPILCLAKKESELAKMIAGANCGVCMAAEDIVGISKSIIELKNSAEYRKTLAENGREFVVNNFAAGKILNEYEKLMFSILKGAADEQN